MDFEKAAGEETPLNFEEAHEQANVQRVIAKELVGEKRESNAEDYVLALKNLDYLLDVVESEKSLLGKSAMYMLKLIDVVSVSPHAAKAVLDALAAAGTGNPWKTKFKEAVDVMAEKVRAGGKNLENSTAGVELRALQEKANTLAEEERTKNG